MEVWRDILDSEGKYQVSNLGNVRSMCKNGGWRRIPKNLSLRKRKDGYLDVKINNGSKRLVHRLVWEAFNGPIPEGYEINHLNCIRDDDHLDNLVLMTHQDNVKWDNADKKRGKVILQYTLDGEFIREWSTQKEIERELGFDQGNISTCCLGKTKQSYGFIWKFKTQDNRYKS